MDFGNAAILIAATFGFVQLLKAVLPDAWVSNSKIVVGLVIASSFAAVFLLSATVWASSQVIGEQSLDQLSTWDKILVSLFLAGAACFGDNFLNAIRNIGSNQPAASPAVVSPLPVAPPAPVGEDTERFASTASSTPVPPVPEPVHPSAEVVAETNAQPVVQEEETSG